MNTILITPLFLLAATASYAQERCTSVADCAQKAMEAAYQAKLAHQIAVPKGAVMAFNLPSCPTGWATFVPLAGRMVLGAGSADGLSARKLNDRGGEEKHKLTVEEMPSHVHSYISSSGVNSPKSIDDSPNEFGLKDTPINTTPAGGDQSHNNMPPFHTLLFCERQ